MLPLLDAGNGGSGQKLDLSKVKGVLQKDPELRILLAGGPTAENVAQTLTDLDDYRSRIVGVDVSGGVEEGGEKDLKKIYNFVKAAKSVG